ncbi:uncharacterized protein [Eurosta solidaginis]|uniref:uncharacterized protein n=1 Tax=Eurosta solidaginis TaxID=178769 RepID=UPI0035317169
MFYKTGIYDSSRFWQTLLSILLAVCVAICHPEKNFESRLLLQQDDGVEYLNSEDITYTKFHARVNWQFFWNDYVLIQKRHFIEKKNKTILEGFVLILERAIGLLGNENIITNSKKMLEEKNISIMAKAISTSFSVDWKKTLSSPKVSLQFLNRENLRWKSTFVPEFNTKKMQKHKAIEITPTALYKYYNKCQSCQVLERIKLMSLEAIKNQILRRLQLPTFPNFTKPLAVPRNIIDTFYKNCDGSIKKQSAFYDIEPQSKSVHEMIAADKLTYNQEVKERNDIFSKAYNKTVMSFMLQDPQPFQYSSVQPKLEYFGRENKRYSQGNFYENNRNLDKLVKSTNVKYEQNDDIQGSYKNNQREFDLSKMSEPVSYAKEQEGYSRFSKYGKYELLKVADDESYSHVNSLYFFPTVSRVRYNQKWEVVEFKFAHSYLTIVRSIMHLYIRGCDWISEHSPEILEHKLNAEKMRRPFEITITIHHVVQCSNNQNFTHIRKLVESHQRIPSGRGQWVQFEIKNIPPSWRNNNAVTMRFVIKTQERWMRHFLAIDPGDSQDKRYALHMEVLVKQPRRRKRSASLDCEESDHEVRCCRYPLKVNFTNFGWNFVVAPTSFDAYFCNGECKVGYMEQYTHTHITSLTTSATPCCSPTKMRPLSLLYFDQDQNLVLSTIPNMSVEKCSCS